MLQIRIGAVTISRPGMSVRSTLSVDSDLLTCLTDMNRTGAVHTAQTGELKDIPFTPLMLRQLSFLNGTESERELALDLLGVGKLNEGVRAILEGCKQDPDISSAFLKQIYTIVDLSFEK